MSNYYNDSRAQAGERETVFTDIDEKKMTATMRLDYEEPAEVNFQWSVCPTCQGSGSHVNPSIDCDGIIESEFADDPEFREEYFSGTYDVTCYECQGKRVVPQLVDQKDIELYEKFCKEEAQYQAEVAAERRMGA